MKRILIATDGSAGAARAIELGLELAEQQDARVLLLHVVPVGGAVAARALDDAASRAGDCGIRFSVEVAAGEAAPQIVARAQALDADLVVIGSRGQAPDTGGALGSVSKAVLSAADRPVLIVYGEPETRATEA